MKDNDIMSASEKEQLIKNIKLDLELAPLETLELLKKIADDSSTISSVLQDIQLSLTRVETILERMLERL